MIKAAIFDFGKVIYKTDWSKANELFFQKNGFNIMAGRTNDEELIRIYKESDIGKEDFKKFFQRLNPEIKDLNQIVEDYKEAYSKSKILNKEML